ncbi:MAG TPA: carboxypeptidase-like regulatory domain-containing protein, partial [Armatimonadota bacterium]
SVASYGPARPPSGAWCHVVKTAADGTYSVRLPEGHSRLYYMGNLPGYAHGTAKPDAQEVDLKEGETKPGVDFLLTLAPKLRGKVLLPDGQPAAGVAIRLLSYGWGPEGVGDPGATTDAQGAFEVTAEDRFPGGGDGPLQMLAQDTDKRLAALVSVADPAQALTMQLAPGAYLAARAVDLKDQPVPQVLVIARGTDRPLATATTDADGQVLLGPLPGGTALRLSAGGRWRYLVAAEEWEGLTVTPAAGAIQQLPPLRLNPQGRSLKGWVGDAAGQPVAGALVYARGVEEPAKTDAQGNFELTGLPARGTLTIVAAHPTEPRFAVKETDPDWGFTPVLALQPLGAVTGQVLDAAGKPAAGARLALSSLMQFYDPPALDVRLREAGCSSYTRAQADAEGRFRLEGLLPGVTYEMYILRDDNLITGHREFQAVPGETVELGEVRPAK